MAGCEAFQGLAPHLRDRHGDAGACGNARFYDSAMMTRYPYLWGLEDFFPASPLLKLLRRLVELLSHPIGELLASGFSGSLPSSPLRMSATEGVLGNELLFDGLAVTSRAFAFSAPRHEINHCYQKYSVKLFSMQCNFHLDFCNALR